MQKQTPLQRFKQALQDACKNGTLVQFWTCDINQPDLILSKRIYRKVRSIHARRADLTGWNDTLPMDQRHTCRVDYPKASEIQEHNGLFIVQDEECPRLVRYYRFTDLTEEPPK